VSVKSSRMRDRRPLTAWGRRLTRVPRTPIGRDRDVEILPYWESLEERRRKERRYAGKKSCTPLSQEIRNTEPIIVWRLNRQCAVRGVGGLRARTRMLPFLNSYERLGGRRRVISKRSVLLFGGKFRGTDGASFKIRRQTPGCSVMKRGRRDPRFGLFGFSREEEGVIHYPKRWKLFPNARNACKTNATGCWGSCL
jgi:hypothetical protein